MTESVVTGRNSSPGMTISGWVELDRIRL